MSEISGSDPYYRPQAAVPWKELRSDISLLSVGGLAMLVSLVLDISGLPYELFHRSGAVAVLFAGIVAFRSLKKHYRKFLNYEHLRDVPTISQNQSRLNKWTLILSIVGTLVWAYGGLIS